MTKNQQVSSIHSLYFLDPGPGPGPGPSPGPGRGRGSGPMVV